MHSSHMKCLISMTLSLVSLLGTTLLTSLLQLRQNSHTLRAAIDLHRGHSAFRRSHSHRHIRWKLCPQPVTTLQPLLRQIAHTPSESLGAFYFST